MIAVRKTVVAVAALAVAGMASAQDAPEVSFDGLHRFDSRNFKLAYADPDVDFTQYTKFIPGTAQFEFRAVKKTSSLQARRSNTREFYIDDKNRQKLEDTVSGIFADELSKSESFTETNTPGPDTLIIRGALHDIVSQVPPDAVGMSDIYLSSVGEATLIIEAVDSLSGEVIWRAIERRAVQRPGGDLMLSNTVTNWAEVRRWARRWASRLREGMDSIHAGGS